MSRLFVVSNRLPSLRSDLNVGGPEAPAGGLANAVMAALRRHPGSSWMGWTGRPAQDEDNEELSQRIVRGVRFLGLPLSKVEIELYYNGYCNRTLWPLFHCFQDLVHVRREEERAYDTVQRRFATALAPHLRADDMLWVHDYHLMLFGRELRDLGWNGRMGFFLHIPFPPLELWTLLADPADTMAALLEYDVAGFHVPRFAENYVQAATRLLGATWDGTHLRWREHVQRVGAYPVGIDLATFVPTPADLERSRAREVLGNVVGERRVLVGVDRLDYTKGITERILSYEEFLRRHPEWRHRVVFLQIAAPSRTRVRAYLERRRQVESLVSRVNGELGEHDWMPIRYLYRTYSQDFLSDLYREADAALITPLRDGMNLVAKEFVAAQDPEHPGVLVLSRTAGAAEELREAVLVNPFVQSDLARGMHEALTMSESERRRRHRALFARVRAGTAEEWGRRFLGELARLDEPAPAPSLMTS
jgi:trehalose 6-phosphate synthase